MYLVDTLSRAVSGEPENQMTHKELILCTELDQVGEMGVTQELAISELTLLNLQKPTEEDEDMRQLMKIIFDGWPEERKTLTENMQDYFPFRDELSVYNGLIFKAHIVLVLQKERENQSCRKLTQAMQEFKAVLDVPEKLCTGQE